MAVQVLRWGAFWDPGEKAHLRVREEFLGIRSLSECAELLMGLLEGSPARTPSTTTGLANPRSHAEALAVPEGGRCT